MKKFTFHTIVITAILYNGCVSPPLEEENKIFRPKNILNYKGIPDSVNDKSMLMYSDQGAWFAYSLPDTLSTRSGFAGPFLMTQQNGVWSSACLSSFRILNAKKNQYVQWDEHKADSYNSHLEQTFSNNMMTLKEELLFSSSYTAQIRHHITNISDKTIEILGVWENLPLMTESLRFTSKNNEVTVHSTKTPAVGHLFFPASTIIVSNDSTYICKSSKKIVVKPNESTTLLSSQTFIFPEYSWKNEKKSLSHIDYGQILSERTIEKENQLVSLAGSLRIGFDYKKYSDVLAKSVLTLQNNWRISAGELKHQGLFPSYHYEWFHGFWSWDSWKHAVGLSYYDVDLAKDQMRAMFDFQTEDGFVVDCIFRDTTVEAHNYRDTKPPLSAWAVVKIYEKDKDKDFVKEFYPKLKKYHQWWYSNRDHDKDGICEYGSTDGTLIAAKWESGMDNAIRFDDAKMLKNNDNAYSLNQESIDLNAYLYAEKIFMEKLAYVIDNKDDAIRYKEESKALKANIQNQFFSQQDGWFYDTNLAGNTFIKSKGSEGWIPLWAKVATQKQARSVKNIMMNPNHFFTKVPFQTMSADHPKFNPLNGYWRGPNWLDQAYFGVEGLRNYGYHQQANLATTKILEGADGLLSRGKSIRENYHPITGKGLNAENFSWSAAHIIMLLINEKQ